MSKANKPELESSCTERFLANKFAPCLLSRCGRLCTIIVYAGLIYGAFYGWSKVTIDFKFEYMIDEDADIYSFIQKSDEYFEIGYTPITYVENAYIDITSERTQLRLLEFNDRLQRCDGCS